MKGGAKRRKGKQESVVVAEQDQAMREQSFQQVQEETQPMARVTRFTFGRNHLWRPACWMRVAVGRVCLERPCPRSGFALIKAVHRLEYELLHRFAPRSCWKVKPRDVRFVCGRLRRAALALSYVQAKKIYQTGRRPLWLGQFTVVGQNTFTVGSDSADTVASSQDLQGEETNDRVRCVQDDGSINEVPESQDGVEEELYQEPLEMEAVEDPVVENPLPPGQENVHAVSPEPSQEEWHDDDFDAGAWIGGTTSEIGWSGGTSRGQPRSGEVLSVARCSGLTAIVWVCVSVGCGKIGFRV